MCGICKADDAKQCAICLEHLCHGYNDKVCYNCLKSSVEHGNTLHPIRRTPVPMCKCGLPYIGECITRSFMTNAYTVDMERLTRCKTAQERRNLMHDPTALIKLDSSAHGRLPQ